MNGALKPLATKRQSKTEREKKVLLGVVDLYIHMNKPIGSQTLMENGFEDLSSATIRNYFSQLEKDGYLAQQHSSGGRIPTEKAFRFYAKHYRLDKKVSKDTENALASFLKQETKQIKDYIRKASEHLSDLITIPVFITEPLLEMDFIQTIKFFALDQERIISVIHTDYGMLHTEILYSSDSFTLEDLSQLEDYFYWRIGKEKHPSLSSNKVKWAQRMYHELMFRYLIFRSSSSFYTSGISKLLHFPECTEMTSLAHVLSLFENEKHLEDLLHKSIDKKEMLCLIGEDLEKNLPHCKDFASIIVPYKIGQTVVGAVAIFAPMRLPYRSLFPLLNRFSELLSEELTKNVYKYQIPFQEGKKASLRSASSILLENKRETTQNHGA